MKLKLRLLRIHKVVLLALTITLLCVVPVLSQVSYKATVSRIVKTTTGVQLSPASQLKPTNNVNQLTQNIYTKIKPPGNPLPKIIIPLGTTDLNKFQNILASKKVSANYYQSVGETHDMGKEGAWESVNVNSVRSTSPAYAVVLSKPNYEKTNHLTFRVIQINNNVPIISFAIRDVALKDSISVDFIVDTGNSGLKSEQIGKAVEAKDYRLHHRDEYSNFQEYKEDLYPGLVEGQQQQQVQRQLPRKVDYLVTISR
ncbi:MAG: hypothetical protein EWV48_05730 [Microcystis aeruginosa Ma_QC_C_20070823_S13]|jgi:hypothetical protein|uniref:Uncharacterized protein n=1 Tax=Microcystis aeruginosa Ma_QC_B_20070730_S2 TaxID=2486256 RepID=A0A552E2T1_MICAE|nr:MAG: hypothetical protein EWV80_04955 [Microcystis aeruginosa Ma_QC_B_20070730_S2]TRU61893.1 MAG: hypothetical protein EWV56_08210 [Microcystis aeruginosa Ma_QC_C_20070823_S13D]TRU64664.1 MAG: hypothetical protein EWV48_05730 [Microcystis aeruginosa Ma_QC_C_20070823_S13]